jgi:putative ABC transport system permease protein
MTRLPAFATALITLLSHWRRRPGQLLALIVGLMSATALWSGVQALNAEARGSYARAAATFSGGDLPMLAAADGGAMPDAAFGALRRAGWPVSPLIEGWVHIGERRLRVLGVDPVSLPRGIGLDALAPGGGGTGAAEPADFLRPPWRALIAPETAAELGLADGAVLTTLEGPLPPALISALAAPGMVLMDIGAAQGVLARPGSIDRLLIASGARADPPDPSAVAGLALIRRAPAPRADLKALTESFHLNLTAFGMLSFLVGLFIVHAAIGLAFEQRLPLMRTLRACGLSATALGAALGAELLGIAVIAGAAGLIAGYAIAGALLPDVAATLRGLYGAEAPGALSLSPWWWAAGLGMTLAGAMAASGGAIWRAARLPALAIAQPEAWRTAQSRALRRQRIAACAVALAAGLFWAAAPGLLSGFALMAGLMLTAALTLPSLLAVALDLGAKRAKGPVSGWAWADARQQISGLSLALMALLLALSTNVGVGSMVQGFRDVFHDWLDHRLSADIYLQAEDTSQADRLVLWLPGRDDVIAIHPRWTAEGPVGGWPTEINGFDDHPKLRTAWQMIEQTPDPWPAAAAGAAALVSEQLARRLDLGIGDDVTVPTPTGDWLMKVAGIYADYGNPRGQMLVSNAALAARWPGVARVRFGLHVAPGARQAVMMALRNDFGLKDSQMIDQTAIKAQSRAIFERTFTVTSALNALTLGVAGAALLTALLTLGAARLPQTAPLWAMGLPRRRIAMLELVRTAALALLTAAFAVPLGIALAWVLVAVVNPEAFGWRLPLRLFPTDWLRLAGLAGLTAALASLPSAWRLARTPPARLLATFAGER